ncbi:uncharacterized protein LOC121866676 isoform X6 [Homarus americanus]|uniref:uncharacterized protein LOC121866676 isoform X6 n=1 Tax=Homarus americanus TaxID=6706 RepID=UPI001C4920F1|nr:uncharacterized protein LOC121866676 isoform X6 [Homarus americanus]
MTKPCTRRQETQEVLNTTLLNLSRQDIARQELCTLPATQDIRRSELPAAGNTEAVLVMVMWPQHLHGDGRTVTTIMTLQADHVKNDDRALAQADGDIFERKTKLYINYFT